jgi:farnesyl-diphosphate farnesyltransferase
VLRGLDTIEDDENLDEKLKLSYLSTFHEDIENSDFVVKNVGKGMYKTLLEEFPRVLSVYLRLDSKYKAIIKDITKQMALGMHEFIRKDVDSIKDYNHYCHYVAGTVGQGLSRIFVQYRLTDFNDFEKEVDLSNEMGLFLQKVNIIRDFIQDIYEERVFWPKAVWSKYVDSLEEFKKKENISLAVKCANDLIKDAMKHIPYCLIYMKRVYEEEQKKKTQGLFTFCAIPQVMAIATLAEIYNNPKMFEGVVKISKGATCRIVMETKNIENVYDFFNEYLLAFEKKKLDVTKIKNWIQLDQMNSNILKRETIDNNFSYIFKNLYLFFAFLVLMFAIYFMITVLYNFKILKSIK